MTALRAARLPVRVRLAAWYAFAVLLAGGTLLVGTTLLATDGLRSYQDAVDDRLADRVVAQLEHVRDERERATLLQVMPVDRDGLWKIDPALEPAVALQGRMRAQAEAAAAAAERERILTRAGLALIVLVLASALAGYALAGRALRPVRRITETAREISAGGLDRRIAAAGPRDDLRELADTFDGMLERLDRAFSEQRRFAAAASHELRTPLAVMRTAIDVALEDPEARPSPRLERMIATLRDTIARSEGLVERLLVLARGDRAPGAGEPVRLDELAARQAELAREQGARVDVRLAPTTVRGDPVLLEQLVRNLVENGVRHGGGALEISTGRPALSVRSDGAPLGPSQLARLGGGRGIGLAIVRSVAAAHGGRVELAARPGGGLVVDVALPAGPD
jgi:signal transduction histidine kinase